MVNWTHNFSPNVLSEAGVGANYVRVTNGGIDHGLGNLGEKLGIANANDHGPELLGDQHLRRGRRFLRQTKYRYRGALRRRGVSSSKTPSSSPTAATCSTPDFSTGGSVSTLMNPGRRRPGWWAFLRRFTAGPDPQAVAGGGSGAGEADFFLGLPESFGRGVDSGGTWGQRAHVFGIYFQDDWRVTDDLTLNLGIRYENHSPWVEAQVAR